jgi:hypothetical protein
MVRGGERRVLEHAGVRRFDTPRVVRRGGRPQDRGARRTRRGTAAPAECAVPPSHAAACGLARLPRHTRRGRSTRRRRPCSLLRWASAAPAASGAPAGECRACVWRPARSPAPRRNQPPGTSHAELDRGAGGREAGAGEPGRRPGEAEAEATRRSLCLVARAQGSGTPGHGHEALLAGHIVRQRGHAGGDGVLAAERPSAEEVAESLPPFLCDPVYGPCNIGQGGSGGSGALARAVVAVTPGATYNVIIGSGGTAGGWGPTVAMRETPRFGIPPAPFS